MNEKRIISGVRVLIESKALGNLIEWLKERGYQVIGPTKKDCAITLDIIDNLDDLPVGWTDDQEAGRYRLVKRKDNAFFGFVVGPSSWKRFLHPPEVCLLAADRQGSSFKILNNTEPPIRYAFLGVRACDFAAIRTQDRVLLQDKFVDSIYQRRRQDNFIVGVNCTQAAPTCFCSSMGTGPKVESEFDLCLTELLSPKAHQFLVEIGSTKGAQAIEAIEHVEASNEVCQRAAQEVEKAGAMIKRKVNTSGIRELFYSNLENPHWDKIAARCLNCANCTMVCPTCFCTTLQDVTDLTGARAERRRKWDSCFNTEFTYIHGGSIRISAKSRYRQWLVHKLASWHDQFGTSGCVGCGRCITWCPVGIDITEEANAFRESEVSRSASRNPALSQPPSP